MAKAVITLGGVQHLVSEGDEITVNRLADAEGKKKISVPANMIVDGKSSKIGTPEVKGSSVDLEVVDNEKRGDKVTAIRYKSKKRVHKVRGHRQSLTQLKVSSIK